MRILKIFFPITALALLLLACSGNTSSNENTAVASSSSTSSSNSGKDTYYEYSITSGSKELSMNGSNKLYISSKGDMRKEQNLTQVMRGRTNLVSVVTIGQLDKPGQTFVINNEDKTYSINKTDPADMDAGLNIKSNAVKIGEEKILSFNCVHARITSVQSAGNISLPEETWDFWKSNEVPVLPAVQKMMNQFEAKNHTMYSQGTAEQLKQMGCDGFLVKMTSSHKDASFNMQLTKVEHRDIPAGMFEIPAGYKEVKE
ncbi:MAG: DUF4412 domain-containing protein [Ginsengibacter sp.]